MSMLYGWPLLVNKTYRISGNFQGICISRISLVQAQFVKYNLEILHRNIWSPAAIREIKILEMENEGPFVKFENNHLYGMLYCSQ